ncbi:hypothetical protein CUU66_20590 [Peribacillus deserti]|uniref:Uncharacterized protein n=2 Tax=Peribacillus deserti TaxID=673318 RepID=A0A2N5M104_9BACI|nr:hypothetical protein CUU66_20590 [Peribacillus deserti]
MIYAGILGIAILIMIFILVLINSIEYFSSFNVVNFQSFVMLFLKAFHIMWSFSLIIFGGHLMTLGCLMFTSDIVPKGISIHKNKFWLGFLKIYKPPQPKQQPVNGNQKKLH